MQQFARPELENPAGAGRDAKVAGQAGKAVVQGQNRRCAPGAARGEARAATVRIAGARIPAPPERPRLARRALGDIGNLVGGFNQKVNVGKEHAAAEAAKAAQQVGTSEQPRDGPASSPVRIDSPGVCASIPLGLPQPDLQLATWHRLPVAGGAHRCAHQACRGAAGRS